MALRPEIALKKCGATLVGMTGTFVGRQDAEVEILRFPQDDSVVLFVSRFGESGGTWKGRRCKAAPTSAGLNWEASAMIEVPCFAPNVSKARKPRTEA